MQNITITGARIKKEIIIFILSFIAAMGLNIYSILKFKTEWNELFSQLYVVILLAIVIYILVLVFRLMFWGITRLIQKK
jgi:Ca2+/H+ antiporter